MSAPLDLALAARLIAEAREDDERMSEAPWSTDPPPRDSEGWPVGAIVAATAPRHGVYSPATRGTSPGADREAIARTRNNLRALADQLEMALTALARCRAAEDLREADRIFPVQGDRWSGAAADADAERLLAGTEDDGYVKALHAEIKREIGERR